MLAHSLEIKMDLVRLLKCVCVHARICICELVSVYRSKEMTIILCFTFMSHLDVRIGNWVLFVILWNVDIDADHSYMLWV